MLSLQAERMCIVFQPWWVHLKMNLTLIVKCTKCMKLVYPSIPNC